MSNLTHKWAGYKVLEGKKNTSVVISHKETKRILKKKGVRDTRLNKEFDNEVSKFELRYS